MTAERLNETIASLEFLAAWFDHFGNYTRARDAERLANGLARVCARNSRRRLMRAPTNAEHQRAGRAARKASGLKRVEVWAHPGDQNTIKDYARKLAMARKTEEAQT